MLTLIPLENIAVITAGCSNRRVNSLSKSRPSVRSPKVITLLEYFEYSFNRSLCIIQLSKQFFLLPFPEDIWVLKSGCNKAVILIVCGLVHIIVALFAIFFFLLA